MFYREINFGDQSGGKQKKKQMSFLNVTLETDRFWAHTPTELWFLAMNKQIKDDEASLCVRRASAWWSRSSWTTWWSRWTEQKTNVSPKRVVTTSAGENLLVPAAQTLSWSPNVFTTTVTTRGIKKQTERTDRCSKHKLTSSINKHSVCLF